MNTLPASFWTGWYVCGNTSTEDRNSQPATQARCWHLLSPCFYAGRARWLHHFDSWRSARSTSQHRSLLTKSLRRGILSTCLEAVERAEKSKKYPNITSIGTRNGVITASIHRAECAFESKGGEKEKTLESLGFSQLSKCEREQKFGMLLRLARCPSRTVVLNAFGRLTLGIFTGIIIVGTQGRLTLFGYAGGVTSLSTCENNDAAGNSIYERVAE